MLPARDLTIYTGEALWLEKERTLTSNGSTSWFGMRSFHINSPETSAVVDNPGGEELEHQLVAPIEIESHPSHNILSWKMNQT